MARVFFFPIPGSLVEPDMVLVAARLCKGEGRLLSQLLPMFSPAWTHTVFPQSSDFIFLSASQSLCSSTDLSAWEKHFYTYMYVYDVNIYINNIWSHIWLYHTHTWEREKDHVFSVTKKNKIIHFLNATADHPIKWTKSVLERQMGAFSHCWILDFLETHSCIFLWHESRSETI